MGAGFEIDAVSSAEIVPGVSLATALLAGIAPSAPAGALVSGTASFANDPDGWFRLAFTRCALAPRRCASNSATKSRGKEVGDATIWLPRSELLPLPARGTPRNLERNAAHFLVNESVRSQNHGSAKLVRTSVKVADAPARFLDEQHAGGGVPFVKPELPERVESSRRHAREV